MGRSRSVFRFGFLALAAQLAGCATIAREPAEPSPDVVDAHAESDADRVPAAACPGYSFEKADYNLDPYRPKYAEARLGVARIHLNVQTKEIYRGTNWASKQFDARSAIRAMLGDPTAYVGSFLFDDIVRFLGGEKTIHPKFVDTVAAVLPSLQAAEKCVRAARAGLRIKQRFARDLTTKYFWSVQNSGKGRVAATFLDYDSKERQDWAPSLVFGTIVSEVADYYGGKTLVYRDPRAFSLALYNFDPGSNRTVPADVGEVVVPGFLPPESIVGFDWKSGDRVGGGDRVWEKELDYSIRREVVDGVPLALLFDSAGQDVLLRREDGTYVGGSIRGILQSIHADTDHPGMPSPNGYVPRLMGAFRACPGKGSCPLPAGLRKKYVASARPIPDGLKMAVANLSFGGSPVRYLAASWVVPDPVIEIKSATFGGGLPGIKPGNVTEAARKSPCQGKTECVYKVSPKFVGDPARGTPKPFELVWYCRNRPKDVKTERLPAPADGKTLTLRCTP